MVVGSENSELSSVLSGVPQGSVLGPLLFIIYINDLPDNLSCTCQIFADDTKIYSTSDHHQSLQKDLYSLLEWSNAWQLEFNTSKCKVLHIGGRNNPGYYYYVDQEQLIPLEIAKSERDLGVTFDEKLLFDIHIDSCIAKSNKLIGLVRRSFVSINKEMFLSLYKSIVRPHLEYGNCIWNPLFKRQSVILENVQRRATKLVPEIAELSYGDRLYFLSLPSLKYRRIRGDLIQLYKLVHGIDNLDSSLFFRFSPVTFTRGDHFKIFVTGCSSSIRKNSFIHRTVKFWNNLKQSSKDATSVNAFKNAVDKELITLHYEYDK